MRASISATWRLSASAASCPISLSRGARITAARRQHRAVYRVTFVVLVFRFGNHVSPPGTRKRGDGNPSPLIHFLAWPDTGPEMVPVFSYGTGYSLPSSSGSPIRRFGRWLFC